MTAGVGSPDPLVDALTRTLGTHRPGDDREARSLQQILEGLDVLVRPFDRRGDLTHVTASGVVVGPRGVVLHLHRRLHRWLQPGGHLDPGESPPAGALRESTEETGLVLRHPVDGPTLIHVDVHGAADDHVHLDIRYVLVVVGDQDVEPAPPPGESQEVRWFSWDEANAVADAALVGALRAARRLAATGSPLAPGWTSEETDG